MYIQSPTSTYELLIRDGGSSQSSRLLAPFIIAQSKAAKPNPRRTHPSNGRGRTRARDDGGGDGLEYHVSWLLDG